MNATGGQQVSRTAQALLGLQGVKVGDSICVVDTDARLRRGETPELVFKTVSKVGRRWVSSGHGWQEQRFDMQTGLIDGRGYTSTHRAYKSREAYEASEALKKAWAELRAQMDRVYAPPDHLTLADIEAMTAKLRGPSK